MNTTAELKAIDAAITALDVTPEHAAVDAAMDAAGTAWILSNNEHA